MRPKFGKNLCSSNKLIWRKFCKNYIFHFSSLTRGHWIPLWPNTPWMGYTPTPCTTCGWLPRVKGGRVRPHPHFQSERNSIVSYPFWYDFALIPKKKYLFFSFFFIFLYSEHLSALIFATFVPNILRDFSQIHFYYQCTNWI